MINRVCRCLKCIHIIFIADFRPTWSFWQAGIGTAAKYNETTFSPRVGGWTNVADAVVHVIHYDWWGNWQWKLDSIDPETQTMQFGLGGFQDAHGGPVASNYFFAENVLEELDAPSEWCKSESVIVSVASDF